MNPIGDKLTCRHTYVSFYNENNFNLVYHGLRLKLDYLIYLKWRAMPVGKEYGF